MHHGLTQGTWSSLHDTGGQPSLTNQQADAERTQAHRHHARPAGAASNGSGCRHERPEPGDGRPPRQPDAVEPGRPAATVGGPQAELGLPPKVAPTEGRQEARPLPCPEGASRPRCGVQPAAGSSPLDGRADLGWLLGCRRLTVRYERRADILQAFLHLACALVCARKLRPIGASLIVRSNAAI
jgi:hypothetical protein